jgi:hypothetical protein
LINVPIVIFFFWKQSGSVVGRNQFRRTRSYNSGKPFEVRQPKLVSYVHFKGTVPADYIGLKVIPWPRLVHDAMYDFIMTFIFASREEKRISNLPSSNRI